MAEIQLGSCLLVWIPHSAATELKLDQILGLKMIRIFKKMYIFIKL